VQDQIEIQWASLDQLLEPDHPVRIVWAGVCKLDLKMWLSEIKAVEGRVGRDATDPRMVPCLWVYATLKRIGSAQELERLCDPDLRVSRAHAGRSDGEPVIGDATFYRESHRRQFLDAVETLGAPAFPIEPSRPRANRQGAAGSDQGRCPRCRSRSAP
jgi:hypothetical protein